jgi:hypothetical protein
MRNLKILINYLIISVFLLGSCSLPSNNVVNTVEPKDINLTISKLPDKLEYNLNETIDLSGGQLIFFDGYENMTIEMNKSLLVESNYFLHTGRNEIRLVLTHLDKKYNISYYVKVNLPYFPVKDIDIYEYDEEIVISNAIKTFNLYALVTPDIATNQKVIWTSSNQDVIEINQSGCINIKNIGQAVITLISQDDTLIKSELRIIVVSSLDLAAINKLVSLLDSYFANIDPNRYSSSNYQQIKEIYNHNLEILFKTYNYDDAKLIYLNAYKQINEIAKLRNNNLYTVPSIPAAESIYASYRLLENDLFITSSGIVNHQLIGLANLDNITIETIVGDGVVIIEDLLVAGIIYVYAGGEESIKLNNIIAEKIIINKTFGAKVKVEINGGVVNTIESISKAKIILNTSVKKIILVAPEKVEILGGGSIDEIVTIADLDVLTNTTITNLIVEDIDRVLNILVNGTILNLTNEAELNLYGFGTIDNLIVHNSITSSLPINNIVVPEYSFKNITLNINEIVDEALILKSNTIITGSHSINIVHANVDEGGIVFLNTPNTVFKIISGVFNINGFIYTSLIGNTTDLNGDFTDEIFMEAYRILVADRLNLIKSDLDINTLLTDDFVLLITEINSMIDLVNNALTPLAIQLIDNNIDCTIEKYHFYKYIVEIFSYTILNQEETITYGVPFELIENQNFIDLNSGKVYFINNLDDLEELSANYFLKVTDPPQISLIDLSEIGEFTFIYRLVDLPPGYINSKNIEVIITFQVVINPLLHPMVNSIIITGNYDNIIYFEGNNIVEYSAKVYDQFDQVMEEESVSFLLAEDYAGLTISENGELVISDLTLPGEYTINAKSNANPSIQGEIITTLTKESLVPTSLEIYGPETAIVYLYETNYVDYTYALFDQYHMLMDEQAVSWSVVDHDFSFTDGRLTIPNTTSQTSLTIRVELATDVFIFAEKILILDLEQQVPTTIEIEGPNSIKLNTNHEVSKHYNFVLYDQYDISIENQFVVWCLLVPIDGVSLDPNTGVVTLQKTVIATSFTLRATSVTNPLIYADKIVAIT